MSQDGSAAADHMDVHAQHRPQTRNHRGARPRALRLVLCAALLELMLVLPFVDHLADANPTIHFTQHGLIFVGGVLIGLALRDVQRSS